MRIAMAAVSLILVLGGPSTVSGEMVGVDTSQTDRDDALARGQQFITALNVIDPYQVEQAAQRFQDYFGEDSAQFTVRLLNSRNDIGFKMVVLMVMVEIQAFEAVPAIIDIINEPRTPEPLMVQAIKSFAALGEATQADFLYPKLHNTGTAVRIAAIDALGRLRVRDAYPRLMPIFSFDRNVAVRMSALRALTLTGGLAAAAPMRFAVRNVREMDNIRYSAMLALAQLEDQDAVGLFIDYARGSYDLIQYAAIVALGMTEDVVVAGDDSERVNREARIAALQTAYETSQSMRNRQAAALVLYAYTQEQTYFDAFSRALGGGEYALEAARTFALVPVEGFEERAKEVFARVSGDRRRLIGTGLTTLGVSRDELYELAGVEVR